MIIIGYPGIGKSSYVRSKGGLRTIDLESSCFIKNEGWATSYSAVAVDLSKQGFDVFVSSHDEVRQALLKSGYRSVFAVYPSLAMKKRWLKRLEVRYHKTLLEKDLRSLERAKSYYEADIEDLKKDASKLRGSFEIRKDYDLGKVLDQFAYMAL